ncbi:MAG: enoyl-CoA hydratase/isomerase family protein [Spirochaetales bacterium]|nr:enoyl-CoA hydratase/isomerase family protein [Spirochaetales bacterium]
MASQEIILSKEKNIAFLTLNRPERKNAFNVPLAKELNRALQEMDKDPDIRVVVIRGSGKDFCVGIDLKEFENRSRGDYDEFIRLMDRHNHTIAEMKKPVIASVRGYAVANGTGLAAACDLTLASETARFGTTAINVGLICLGPAAPIQASIGRKRTLELLLTGRIIDAHEAERLGLVNRVLPDADLDGETRKLAEQLASKSPLALEAGKTGLYRCEDLPYKESLELRSGLFAALCGTEEAKEGVKAFLLQHP